MIEWEPAKREGVYLYLGEDVSSCVYFEQHSCCWDVSGPSGRGTKGSGTVPISGDPQGALRKAKRQARLFIAGYRSGMRDALGRYGHTVRRVPPETDKTAG